MKDLETNFNKKLDALVKTNESSASKNNDLQDSNKNLQNKVDQLEADKLKLEVAHEACQGHDELTKQKDSLLKLDKELENCNKDLQNKLEKLENDVNANKELQNKLEKLANEKKEFEQQMQQQKQQIERLNSIFDEELEKSHRDLKNKLETLENEKKTFQEQMKKQKEEASLLLATWQKKTDEVAITYNTKYESKNLTVRIEFFS